MDDIELKTRLIHAIQTGMVMELTVTQTPRATGTVYSTEYLIETGSVQYKVVIQSLIHPDEEHLYRAESKLSLPMHILTYLAAVV